MDATKDFHGKKEMGITSNYCFSKILTYKYFMLRMIQFIVYMAKIAK